MTDEEAKKIAKKVADEIMFWVIGGLWALAVLIAVDHFWTAF